MALKFRAGVLALLVLAGCSNRTQRSDALSGKGFRVQMKEFGIRQAKVELHFTWFFGPRFPKPIRTIYFTDWDINSPQITDPKILEKIKESGLEDKMKLEGLAHVKGGAWLDLPGLPPFPAAAMVTVFDDASLVSKPGMYWRDDPNRTPLQRAIFSNDIADVLRLLSSGKINSRELNDGLFWACGADSTQILQALLRSGANVNVVSDKDKEHITPLMLRR
jgi:hypothetical protein